MRNASSLLTYDSRFLVNNFLYGPKHDPTFQPLFPEDAPLGPGAPELCDGDPFCSFDVAATGSLSVGNATRAAHQLHQRHLQSLQPGEAGGRAGGAPREGRGGARGGSRGSPAPCLRAVVSCGWLGPPAHGRKDGTRYLQGSTLFFHCDNGYSLDGAEVSRCQDNGEWSHPTPTCQPGEDARPPGRQNPAARPGQTPPPTRSVRPAPTLPGPTPHHTLAPPHPYTCSAHRLHL